jgi:hypothetical protein
MKKVIYGLLAFGPVLALAQGTGSTGTIVATATDWASGFSTVVHILIPAVFALAILFFFWGMAKYILSAGDATKAAEGKSIMIYGVIAIAVMAVLFGLVQWLAGAVGINPTTSSFQAVNVTS